MLPSLQTLQEELCDLRRVNTLLDPNFSGETYLTSVLVGDGLIVGGVGRGTRRQVVVSGGHVRGCLEVI